MMYMAYNSIRPIYTEDYYHAISEANRAASVGVKKVSMEDYYVDWFKDVDEEKRAHDRQRMESAKLKLEMAKKVAEASMREKGKLVTKQK